MATWLSKTLIIVAAAAVVGCSSQAVEIRPQLAAAPEPAAVGQQVSLVVRDERPSALIGVREVRGTRHGDITAAAEITGIVTTALTEALRSKGFDVRASADSGATLMVDVRHLELREYSGIVAGGTDTRAAINARVLSDNTLLYERLYRGESRSGGQVFVGSASSNEKNINAALTTALQQLVDDPQLTAALISVGRATP